MFRIFFFQKVLLRSKIVTCNCKSAQDRLLEKLYLRIRSLVNVLGAGKKIICNLVLVTRSTHVFRPVLHSHI